VPINLSNLPKKREEKVERKRQTSKHSSSQESVIEIEIPKKEKAFTEDLEKLLMMTV